MITTRTRIATMTESLDENEGDTNADSRPVEVDLDLDKDWLEAVGDYWFSPDYKDKRLR